MMFYRIKTTKSDEAVIARGTTNAGDAAIGNLESGFLESNNCSGSAADDTKAYGNGFPRNVKDLLSNVNLRVKSCCFRGKQLYNRVSTSDKPLTKEQRSLYRSRPVKCAFKVTFHAICMLILLLCAYLTWVTIYSSLISKNPCDVAVSTREKILQNIKYITESPRMSKNDSVYNPHVPRIIHQQWKTSEESDVPEKYRKWHSTWAAMFPSPEYEHMFWSDDSARNLIETHYSWFLPVYDGYEFNIQRADAARYFILYHYGGIYADLDYEPMTNFWDLIPKDRVGLVESPYQYHEYVQNSLMSSPVQDPFWLDVFDVLVEKARAPVLSSTGPVLLDVVMERTEEPWMILPCENFQRLPLGELDKSPFVTLLHREILGRFFPMKRCGNFNDQTCQYAKHHNTASYVKDTGVLKLLLSGGSKQPKA